MDQGDLNNRFTYHTPDSEQIPKYQVIRDRALGLAELINAACPESREKSLAVTNLEQAVMWANASIARHSA